MFLQFAVLACLTMNYLKLRMAALRQISTTSKSHPSLSQCLFLRTMTSKIFVKGLAFSTTVEKLAEAFSQYGSVLKANIVLNKAKTRSKGFGYVTFAKEEEARKAQIGMDRKILHGRVLYVDMQPPDKQNISFPEQGRQHLDPGKEGAESPVSVSR